MIEYPGLRRADATISLTPAIPSAVKPGVSEGSFTSSGKLSSLREEREFEFFRLELLLHIPLLLGKKEFKQQEMH